jgi:hypothetical protein
VLTLRSLGQAVGLAALLVCLACVGTGPWSADPPPASTALGPSIVLITLEGLRPDLLGALGAEPTWTPKLDRFSATATWTGRAVAPSSALVPSAASLFTSLRPWQHQVILPGQKTLGTDLEILTESLARRGYRGLGFSDSRELRLVDGWARGLATFESLRQGQRAGLELAQLEPEGQFLWIHLTGPSPPYIRRPWMVDQLDGATRLPRRIEEGELEPYLDPSRPLPEAKRRELWAMYRLNALTTDAFLGRLLEGLEANPHRDRLVVAITSLHGQEFKEHGQIGAGGNLGRAGLEVPLILKLPEDSPHTLQVPPSERVAQLRLASTLLELAGAPRSVAAPPSLFDATPYPLLSELYQSAGANELSLVEGDLQLRWRVRFADAERTYYAARLATLGQGRESPARLELRALMSRLAFEFRATPPISGRPDRPAELTLFRWTAQGVERVENPAQSGRLASRARLAWSRFVGPERTLEREEALRRGY